MKIFMHLENVENIGMIDIFCYLFGLVLLLSEAFCFEAWCITWMDLIGTEVTWLPSLCLFQDTHIKVIGSGS